MFDSFWWTMTTLTTVGYGDFYPSSVAGRWLGIFLFLFGIGDYRGVDWETRRNRCDVPTLKTGGEASVSRGRAIRVYRMVAENEKAIDEVLSYEPKAEIVLIDPLREEPYSPRPNPFHFRGTHRTRRFYCKRIF